jgi:hypothetical protein
MAKPFAIAKEMVEERKVRRQSDAVKQRALRRTL